MLYPQSFHHRQSSSEATGAERRATGGLSFFYNLMADLCMSFTYRSGHSVVLKRLEKQILGLSVLLESVFLGHDD